MSDCCKVCNAIEIAMDKCKKERQKIIDGNIEMPIGFQSGSEDIWSDILEQRFDHLESLELTLKFLLENENRNKLQV